MAANNSKLVPIFSILLPVILGYAMYTGDGVQMLGFSGLRAGAARADSVRDTIARLEAATDSAKRELARGTAEDLRRRLEGHRASLALLRRLVPERSEVPNLLDDISTRAKIRGVTLSEVVPQAEEPGPVPFNTNRYEMQVIGHYDQIGKFLADVASLQRIIVPSNVTIQIANANAARVLGDSTGALLEARFEVRTYVKADDADLSAEEAASET